MGFDPATEVMNKLSAARGSEDLTGVNDRTLTNMRNKLVEVQVEFDKLQ